MLQRTRFTLEVVAPDHEDFSLTEQEAMELLRELELQLQKYGYVVDSSKFEQQSEKES